MCDRWKGDSFLGWALLAVLIAGGPARGQHGSASELDYDRGDIAAREIVAFGHAITGDLIEPHAHGREVCYEPHLADLPQLRITYITDYQAAPTHPVDRYRHAHHHGNVVQEHAHHYAGDHDHRPGSELDYLAAYERYQRTERANEFDEYTFVVDRFERKVPTYRIHGTAPSKPQRRAEPDQGDAGQRDVTLTEELAAQEAPVAPAADGEAEGDAPELDDVVDAYDDEVSSEVIQTGTEIIIGDDPRHRDRIVDDYRRKRRDDRHDFDKQTHNRLDPSKNRRHIKGGDDRRGDNRHGGKRPDKPAKQPDLSERIQADNADLGARIDSRAVQQGTRLDQRLIDATR